MAIQVRRGNESDFDASKMLPGEWAVSLDTKYVRMCFAPGVVLRMATYEGFENDKAQFQAILAECRSIQSAVQRIQSEVNAKAALTVEYSNSAKESADRAYSEAERAKTYADNAEAVTGVQIATKDRAGLIKGGDNYIAEDGTLTLITATTSTTQPNSYAGRENILEIGGVTEQDSTAGNQLLDVSTCTYGNINASGVFTENMTNMISDYIRSNGEIYVATNANVAGIGIAFYDANKNYLNRLVATSTNHSASQKVDGCEYVRVWFGVDSNNLTIERLATYKPMINKGTTALPYEKFSGGIPAPNPSYPMEIKKTVISGVKTYWKNFIDSSYRNSAGNIYTINGTTTENNGLYSVVASNADLYIWAAKNVGLSYNENCGKLNLIPSGTEYITISLSNEAFTNNYLSFFDKNKVSLGYVRCGKESTVNVPNGAIYFTLRFGISNAVSGTTYKTTVMVEVGTTATEYEPYTESTATLSQPIELYGKNGVQDIFTAKQTKRKYVKYVFTGGEDWLYYDSTLGGGIEYRTYLDLQSSNNDGNAVPNALCNVAKATSASLSWSYNKDTFSLYSKTFYLRVPSWKDVTDVNTLKAKLKALYDAGTPAYVVYELAEEVTEELPIADQIALNSLATYDGITYVEFDSEIQPTFKAEYGTSKVGGYTLEAMLAGRNGELYGKDYNSRLSALEASVVNNI